MMQVPRLRAVRQGRLMTQAELAQKAGLGAPTISLAENGRRPVRMSTVKRLAKALGVHPAELLAADGEAARAA